MKQTTRRNFLAATGLAGFGALLGGRTIRAQAERAPKRLVLFMSRYGTIDSNWRMRDDAFSGEGDHRFALDAMPEDRWSPILQPLYPVREHLNVLEGFSQLSVELGREGSLHAYGHSPSAVSMATGAAWSVPDSQASRPGGDRSCTSHGASIDQIVADALHRDGALRSLELGGGGWRYREGGVSLSAEADPAAVYQRLFPTTDAEEAPDDGRERMLALVAQDLEEMGPRLGRSDRARMESHRHLVENLRTQLSLGPVAAGCSAPTLTGQTHEDFYRLITTAFACDVTRVVSYKIGQLAPAEFGFPGGTNIHQDLAHRENGDPTTSGSMGMTQMYRAMADEFRKLVEMLASTPEPLEPGTSLLDHSAVLWMTEQANGEHKITKVPYVVAGGAGGALHRGQYLYYPTKHQVRSNDGRSRSWYQGHNHVLVSMAQAMGLATDTIGLAEVSDAAGNRFSLRGGLEALLA